MAFPLEYRLHLDTGQPSPDDQGDLEHLPILQRPALHFQAMLSRKSLLGNRSKILDKGNHGQTSLMSADSRNTYLRVRYHPPPDMDRRQIFQFAEDLFPVMHTPTNTE